MSTSIFCRVSEAEPPTQHIRLFATNHLGSLIRASATTNAWTLRLLLTQLYDPAFEVREVAVRFLEEACESTDVLQSVVEMQPTLDHLGEMGHPLMLKCVGTPTCRVRVLTDGSGSCRPRWAFASCMPPITLIAKWTYGSTCASAICRLVRKR